MKIFRGPFHPHLENAFIEAVQDFKSDDPLKPLLVVVPADTLKRHLMKQLTLGHECHLIDITFLNFNQLATILCEERPGNRDFTLKDDLFFEETLRQNLRLPESSGTDLSTLNRSEGGISALWQTIRDLKEGLVSPKIVAQALKEGHFGKGAMRGHLPHLMQHYNHLIATCREHRIFDYSDLALLATQCTPDAPFLKRFEGIFYYGFYDLTQTLIDFLHTLIKYYPATVFFPVLKNGPGWVFSERFFERYIEGLASDSDELIDLTIRSKPELLPPACHLFDEENPDSPQKPETSAECVIISCFDKQDEILMAAKEILRLTEEENVSFDEIGVVTREIPPYLPGIIDCFQKHAVPFHTECEISLIRYPLAKTVLDLSQLLVEDFPRAHCIDLITTPFFRTTGYCEEETIPEPETWDFISRQARIKKGIDSWKRLREKSVIKDTHFSAQADLLWEIVSTLYTDLNDLPHQTSWAEHAERWEALLVKTLGFKPLLANKQKSEMLTQDESLNDEILKTLHRLAELDPVARPVSRQDFIQAFQRGLKRTTLPISKKNIPGVSVMNVMQARGICFRILFLLGLNEGTFPRAIREDPLLQDSQRRILETVLGYKAGEKLAGYDEEKLLFILVAGSARSKLYALYHRTDGLGNPANSSGYVNELKRIFLRKDTDKEYVVPQGLVERRAVSPFNREELILPDEEAVYLNLTGQSCDALLGDLPFLPSHYTQGETALKALESDGPLTPFDGLITTDQDHWTTLLERGISPTRLERYAKCPFQYFATKLLHLAPMETPEDDTEAASSDIGTLFHDILNNVYKVLHQDNYFMTIPKPDLPRTLLTRISMTHFEQYESKTPPHYPVHWEEMKNQILLILEAVIEADLKILAESGYHPAAFEVERRQKLEAGWPEFFGRIDRMDFKPDEGKIRVVDYKVTFRKSPKTGEKNLVLSALRGERLQAPVYLRLAEEFAEEWHTEEGNQCSAVFYHIAPNWSDGPLVVSEFSEDGWQGACGDLLKQTFSTLFEGMASGKFFMNPGEYCTFCDVRTLCRQHHLPSRLRIEADITWQNHLALKKIKPPKTSGTPKKENTE